ncbi:MAG TPA: glycosyltransferase family 39 protein [Afifellaceae bacterium]|nr:glycosyltransferase family 39 protein [Afifellaceae bacterium]
MSDTTVPVARPTSLRGVAIPLLLAVSLVYSLAAIFGTYRTYNHTSDEGAHIAAGVELLDAGTYDTEPKHPPIARIALGLGPWLLGADSKRENLGLFFTEGNRILYETGDYWQILTAARLGNLPFFLLMLLATWLIARRSFGAEVAACSVFFTATTPILIGNAAVATLDTAPVAFGLLALYAFLNWLDEPDRNNSVWLGLFSAAAILSKFSALAFLVVTFAAILAWRFWLARRHKAADAFLAGNHFTHLRLLIGAGLLVAWASYGFRLTPLVDSDPETAPAGLIQVIAHAEIFPAFLKRVPVGLMQMAGFARVGHPSFFLGEAGPGGWPHYYLVGLMVRTPLPLLGLGLAGFVMMIRTALRNADYAVAAPALMFAAIMTFVSLTSSINIGVRHILIVYPLLAIGAGYCLFRICSLVRFRVAALAGALVMTAWQFAASVHAHPDQLVYFNLLAGRHPERILINGDLDWGQDLERLAAELRARDVTSISLDYSGSADPVRHGIAGYKALPPGRPVTGWVAVSLFQHAWNHEGYAWLADYRPVARVGKSIDLYYIPEATAGASGGS